MKKRKDAREAYYEACKGINIKENEKIVIEREDFEYCYRFAKFIYGANISELEKIILESKDYYYCYLFARDIIGANIKAHEEIVIKSKDIHYCCEFARNVSEANKEELFKVVLEYGNKEDISFFLDEIKFNKEKFKNYLLFI